MNSKRASDKLFRNGSIKTTGCIDLIAASSGAAIAPAFLVRLLLYLPVLLKNMVGLDFYAKLATSMPTGQIVRMGFNTSRQHTNPKRKQGGQYGA
jgi:hypothetical protein